MAARSLGLKDGARGYADTLEKKGQFRGRRLRFHDVYYVITDTLDDGIDAIKSALETSHGIVLGVYDSVTGTYVIGIAPKESGRIIHPISNAAAALYEVTVTYDSDFDAEQSSPEGATGWRPKRKWYSVKEEEELEKDVITGKPITTQAGEKIHILDTVVYPILEIERYETYPFDPKIFMGYSDTTNLEPFYGAPPGDALMDDIQSEEEIINGTLLQKTKYVIKFHPKLLEDIEGEPQTGLMSTIEVLHQGFLYIDPRVDPTGKGLGPDFKPRTKLDKNGTPQRVNLKTDIRGKPGDPGDQAGTPVAYLGGTILPEDEEPNFLVFNRKPKVSWSLLNLQF